VVRRERGKQPLWKGILVPKAREELGKIAQDRVLQLGTDPVAFSAALGIEPDPWQAAVLRSSSKRILLNCSRQAGKSTVASVLALHRAVYSPGSLVLLVSGRFETTIYVVLGFLEFLSQ
jgi:hypothetical protein